MIGNATEASALLSTGGLALEQWLFAVMVCAIRPGAAFIASPVFGGMRLPLQLRIILAMVVAMTVNHLHPPQIIPDTILNVDVLFAILMEVLIGAAMGFALQTGFAGAQLAGEAISNAMGLGFAAMNDPMTGQFSNLIGQLLMMIATLLFFTTDSHLIFIQALVESYSGSPFGEVTMQRSLLMDLANIGQSVFLIGLSVALPVSFATILVHLVMGYLSRSAPALNLFSVGMPVALLVGLFVLAASMSTMVEGITLGIGQGVSIMQSFAAIDMPVTP